MKKIAFILNPIAGGKNKYAIPALAKSILGKEGIEVVNWWWENGASPEEAIADLKKQGIKTFVAVGGDGTINKVACSLINTDAALGLVPMGSGNGLARHYKIPMDPASAIRKLLYPQSKYMDTYLVNDKHPFINIAGVGFDAHIGHLFATAGSRGLKTYARITLKELRNYKPQEYTLEYGGNTYHEKAFLIAIANGSQWGNNVRIAPQASTTDHLLDIVMIKPFPFYASPGLITKLLSGNIHKAKEVMHTRTPSITISSAQPMALHLDGEPFGETTKVKVSLQPSSLHLLT